jgi:hypothetical protein
VGLDVRQLMLDECRLTSVRISVAGRFQAPGVEGSAFSGQSSMFGASASVRVASREVRGDCCAGVGGVRRGSCDVPCTFDPAAYSRAFKVDGDCMLVESITDCDVCCGYAGVNRSAAADDYEDVRDACSSGTGCPMMCEVPKVSCVDSFCTLSSEQK